MKIYKDLEQGSDEWHKIRESKFTASHATAIGNAKVGLTTLVQSMLVKKYSRGEDENFSNAETDRGNELEPIAIGAYEMLTGCKVEAVGFIELNESVGCSPDGLVGENGLVEIKCKDDKPYFKMLMEDKADSSHIWQVQHQMLVTGREWCDIGYYNPNFKHSLHVIRVEVDPTMQEKLKLGIAKGKGLMKEMENNYINLLPND